MLVQIEMRGPDDVRLSECDAVPACPSRHRHVTRRWTRPTRSPAEPTVLKLASLHLSLFLDMAVTDSFSFLQSEIFENNKIVS